MEDPHDEESDADQVMDQFAAGCMLTPGILYLVMVFGIFAAGDLSDGDLLDVATVFTVLFAIPVVIAAGFGVAAIVGKIRGGSTIRPTKAIAGAVAVLLGIVTLTLPSMLADPDERPVRRSSQNRPSPPAAERPSTAGDILSDETCAAQAAETMRQFPGVYSSEEEYIEICTGASRELLDELLEDGG